MEQGYIFQNRDFVTRLATSQTNCLGFWFRIDTCTGPPIFHVLNYFLTRKQTHKKRDLPPNSRHKSNRHGNSRIGSSWSYWQQTPPIILDFGSKMTPVQCPPFSVFLTDSLDHRSPCLNYMSNEGQSSDRLQCALPSMG